MNEDSGPRGRLGRVLLIGLGPTALSAVESLAPMFHIVGIVRAQDPSPGHEVDTVLSLARQLGVSVFSDITLDGVERAVMATRPDCTVVSSYNRVLPDRILRLGRFVNVHYAPLPEYRGRANLNWAIINSEPESAISIHVVAPGLDAGNILFQRRVPVGARDTVDDLYAVLNALQRESLGRTVAEYIAGYEGQAQDEAAATYGCTRVPEDGEIDWSDSTEKIYALIRALARPYPGARSYLGLDRVIIVRAAPVNCPPRYVGRVPGRVVGRSRADGHVDVLTGDGVLRIHEVAISDSAPPMPASTVITSTKQTLGLRLSDLVARIQAIESQLQQRQDGEQRA
jgi:methionyl-tRNA formyltransferase